MLSQDIFNARSGTVIAMALTSQIRSLDTDRIGARLGRCTPAQLRQIIDGLNEILAPG